MHVVEQAPHDLGPRTLQDEGVSIFGENGVAVLKICAGGMWSTWYSGTQQLRIPAYGIFTDTLFGYQAKVARSIPLD
jgi:hypothetical protein